MRVLLMVAAMATALPALIPASALAQAQSTSPSKAGCDAAPAATPATPETRSAESGTAPGNSGSTGFSGSGLGGAYTGTTPNGAVATSPSVQPATAKGLDPIRAAPKPGNAGRC